MVEKGGGGGGNNALAVDAVIDEEENPYDDDDDDDNEGKEEGRDVLEGCSCCLRRWAACLSAKATRRWKEEDAARLNAMFLLV